MKPELLELLRELEAFGKANDAASSDRRQKMLNITHDTGVFLSVLIQAARARAVLEIGTSNGYSTLWLADAVGESGLVTTIEMATHKIEMAARNFERGGVAARIRQVTDEAGSFMATCRDAEYDFIFLDSDREQYVDWWSELRRILRPGSLIVVDNAVSHAHQMEQFTALLASTTGYLSSLCPIGNGELMILKQAGD
ncbi:MAG TPA: O-methyltransferase [Kofleriaceae bacterium]|nr:O-methyltransferase [Kofleriaceae bacterium]